MANNFFNKTKGIKTIKAKYEYVKNHFTYCTMNSWNGLKSIANNVKIYNLGLTKLQEHVAYNNPYNPDDCESCLLWEDLGTLIDDSEMKAGFNGRSDGYIVLYNDDNNGTVLSDLFNYDSMEEYKQFLLDCNYTKRDANYEISSMVDKDFELVKRFDKLCDDLRSFFLGWINAREFTISIPYEEAVSLWEEPLNDNYYTCYTLSKTTIKSTEKWYGVTLGGTKQKVLITGTLSNVQKLIDDCEITDYYIEEK